jgi:two-component system, chemotaxis family, protein-glutamate methylesterase/glutaminase
VNALVVDDSLVYLRIMGDVLEKVGGMTRVFRASNATEAMQLLKNSQVDIAFLDIEMPDVDGLELLTMIKREHSAIDVVMVSGKKGTGIDQTVKALELGALAYIDKPIESGFEKSVQKLTEDLKPVISTIRVRRETVSRAAIFARTSGKPAEVDRPVGQTRINRLNRRDFWVVLIGVSTGGPEALSNMIPHLPGNFPLPIVVVQHMPKGFTESFAKSLDTKSQLKVKEAVAGESIEAGTVYIAPGGIHTELGSGCDGAIIKFSDIPPENSVKPAVDVLFRSVPLLGDRRPVISVIMTGMGEDGCRGVESLKGAGCFCITQSPETCVVYGMPRAVDEAGLADESDSLKDIARRLQELALCTGALA